MMFIVLVIFALKCGETPEGLPPVEVGDLKITAYYQGNLTDSLTLSIDDYIVGTTANPHIHKGIISGKHKIFASYREYIGESRLVWITKNILTSVDIMLYTTGPYEGFIAPEFTSRDISNKSIRLSDYRGKIVFLCFFEHG